MIQQLSQDEGVNLVGIKKIIDLQNQVDALKSRNEELETEVMSRMSAAKVREARRLRCRHWLVTSSRSRVAGGPGVGPSRV